MTPQIYEWAASLGERPIMLATQFADPDKATGVSARIAMRALAEPHLDTTTRFPKYADLAAFDPESRPEVITSAIDSADRDVLKLAAERTELIARAAHDQIISRCEGFAADRVAVLGMWRLGEDRLADDHLAAVISELERRMISLAAELVAPKPPAEWCALWAVPRTYRALCEAWQPDEHEHPLPALLMAWLEHRIDPIHEGTSMVPVRVAPRERQARLVDLTPQAQQPTAQLPLPTFAPHRDAVPPWLLDVYDQMGSYATGGSGAPIALRLLTATLLRHPRDQRGLRQHIELPASELVRWVWPNGWSQAAQRWHTLTAALDLIHRWRIPLREQGDFWAPITVRRIPASLDGWCVMDLELPDNAPGARIDIDRLAAYGVRSNPLFRAYLASACIIDKAATNGRPVTRSRSSSLQLRFVRRMDAHDLARTIDGSYDSLNPKGKRRRRRSALDAYVRLDKDGVIDLMPVGDKWRVLGVRKPDRSHSP